MSKPAYYDRDGERYVPTDFTRGPWSPEHQHGGPPTALLARTAATFDAESGMHVARLTVELVRPIPLRPLKVRAEIESASRTTQRIGLWLDDGDVVLARARALRLRTQPIEVERVAPADPIEAARHAPPGPEYVAPFAFNFFRSEVGYHTSIELRLARGQVGHGPVVMWMRPLVDLVRGEAMSALERVLACADSGSGVSQILDPHRWSFLNADLDVHLHRLPTDEWLALDAQTIIEPTGVGLATSVILDRHGACGRAAQSLIVRSR